jgi:thioredoxin-like negative regulator of GroEL
MPWKEIQALSDWNHLLSESQRVLAFFVHPECSACVKYQSTKEKFHDLWMNYRNKKWPVTFAQVDISKKSIQESGIREQYKIRFLPSVAYFVNGEFQSLLEHRKYTRMETWIQKEFEINRSVDEMLAVQAVYELSRLCKAETLDKKKAAILQFLIEEHMNHDYIELNMLQEWHGLVNLNSPVNNNSNSSKKQLWKELYHSILFN